jgi:HSP20 family protein
MNFEKQKNNDLRFIINDKNKKYDDDSYCFKPFADMYESAKTIVIQVELSGVKKENLNIELGDGFIQINGIRTKCRSQEEENYQRMERSYGFFKRSFYLPKNIKADGITASFKDGVLEIVIPKNIDINSKKIKIY